MSSWHAGSRQKLGSCGSSRTHPRSRSWPSRWHRMQAATSVRSGPQPSGTGALVRKRTSSIGTDGTRTCRSKASTLPSRGVAGPTSTSACRPIRPKQESRQHSKLADAWRTVRMRPTGGHSRRPRTTVSTSRRGRTSRTTRRTEPGSDDGVLPRGTVGHAPGDARGGACGHHREGGRPTRWHRAGGGISP